MIYQRDAFINQVYSFAKKRKNIFFLSADFGAPALDSFRKNLPNQFIHMGISEQNMVDVAAGLALEGNKVFIYAMAPFVILRCLEQHKSSTGIMNLPVTTIVTGVGLSYADAGPTHYSTEELASIYSLVNSNVYTASDGLLAKSIAYKLCTKSEYSFVRLDRDLCFNIKKNISVLDFNRGFRYIHKNGNQLCILTHGYMTQKINKIVNEDRSIRKKISVVEVFRSKPLSQSLKVIISKYRNILVIDEQMPLSGLKISINDFIIQNQLSSHIYNLSLNENYIFENGGRDYLLEKNGLGNKRILNKIADIIN